jgi:UDP-xylose/UDP-N-acetylglucosamine transporter B4
MQNICVRSIYFLLSEWTSLAVTLVTTLRKFLSLLLSVLLFNNTFTPEHWLSAVLVFSGSALFSGLITLPGEARLERILAGVFREQHTLPT